MPTKLIAYLGDTKLKKRFVEEIKKHEKADAIIQGVYGTGSGENWKGCAVGCSLKSMNGILKKDDSVSSHTRYESELGIPQILARLEDRIFEGLDVKEAKTWPRRFAEAVPVSADLSHVWPKFAIWLLTDKKNGVIRFANGRKDVIEAIQNVAKAYQAQEKGEAISHNSWMSLRRAAAAAAYADAAAADAAADAAAAYADAAAAAAAYADAAAAAAYADAAADAAAAAAAYAAAAAAYADAAAAKQKYFSRMSKKLLELIKKTV